MSEGEVFRKVQRGRDKGVVRVESGKGKKEVIRKKRERSPSEPRRNRSTGSSSFSSSEEEHSPSSVKVSM